MFKSLALTISKCMRTAIFLYMISYNTEIYGQAVTLDPNGVEFISSCSNDLKVGDFYIYRGTVDATNGIVANFVDFQIKATTDSDFKDLCSASLLSCATPNSQPCYCAVKNGVIYQIVANRSAIVSYSKAEIRILWRNSPDVPSNNKLILPKIIDVTKDTNTSLTVDGVNYGMNCPSNVIHGSVMTYQCVNSPSPCDLTIEINKTEVAKGEHNVTYTVSTNLTFTAVHSFTFSHFVCGVPKQPMTCHVIIGSKCSLSCEDWAIALSVIFFVAILVIISTGITILVEVKKKEHETVIKRDKKTVAFYLCIGFLVFAEVLDIILIIVFAQANPCKCDPQPGILLALWEIMLIIFCIVNGLLIIATVVVLIWIFVFEKKEHDTGSNSPEITPTTTTNTANTRNHKNNNGQNATHLSNGKKDKEKSNEEHEMWQSKKELPKLPNTPDEPKKDEAETQASEQSEVRKLKKKKSSKRKKATKEHVEESSSPNRPLPNLKTPESRNPNDLHPQAPAGTTMPNPYANAKK